MTGAARRRPGVGEGAVGARGERRGGVRAVSAEGLVRGEVGHAFRRGRETNRVVPVIIRLTAGVLHEGRPPHAVGGAGGTIGDVVERRGRRVQLRERRPGGGRRVDVVRAIDASPAVRVGDLDDSPQPHRARVRRRVVRVAGEVHHPAREAGRVDEINLVCAEVGREPAVTGQRRYRSRRVEVSERVGEAVRVLPEPPELAAVDESRRRILPGDEPLDVGVRDRGREAEADAVAIDTLSGHAVEAFARVLAHDRHGLGAPRDGRQRERRSAREVIAATRDRERHRLPDVVRVAISDHSLAVRPE